ncbi:MAG: S1C family serine protease [Candidatus Brocadiales bacterium]
MVYRTTSLIALVGAFLCALCSSLSVSSWAEDSGLTSRETLKSELRALEEKTHPFVETFRKVVQLVSPSVVSIRTERGSEYAAGFRKQFGPRGQEFGVPMPGPQSPEGRPNLHPGLDFPIHGQGSGLIIDTEGHILTNYHVVEGFEEGTITVITHDGRQYEAKVVGLDSKTDLGILKVEADGLQPAEFGSSDDVHVGDWVIAIGNPFGYQQTVSAGIVSATGRKGVIPFAKPFSYEDFIQTDAAINPGNSGGPLVNMRGEVIGISTAIATRTGGFQGVGFATSVSIAEEVIRELVEKGRVVRGYLGVGIRNIDDDLAHTLGYSNKVELLREYGLPSNEGAFVSGVWDDTPAAKGRIKPGDVIIVIDNENVFNAETVQRYIRHIKVESTVNVVIVRDKNTLTLPIKIEEQPEDLGDREYVSITQRVAPAEGNLD